MTDLLERYYGDADMIFCGGQRRSEENSEAAILGRWAMHQPEMHNQPSLSVYTLAKSKYTAGDMEALADWLKTHGDYDLVYLISHPDHTELAHETLRNCGINSRVGFYHLNSGEEAPYPPRTLKIIRWVYQHDPKWQSWHSWPFRVLANRRGRDE